MKAHPGFLAQVLVAVAGGTPLIQTGSSAAHAVKRESNLSTLDVGGQQNPKSDQGWPLFFSVNPQNTQHYREALLPDGQ